MVPFVGRASDLALLQSELSGVSETGEGRLVLLRGRRRVGKSRLVEEFLEQAQRPAAFFTASKQGRRRELELFAEEVAGSQLPAAEGVRAGAAFSSWEAALSIASAEGTRPDPVVIVLDEFPYLVAEDPSIEAVLQKVWDRVLSRRPVLLILIGSDVAMMEALTEHGRPLFGRLSRELVLGPFSPRETAELIRLEPLDALDAFVVIGGFPLPALRWRRAQPLWSFLQEALSDSTHPLIVDAERSLAAEYPPETQARLVLNAIGAGERTFTKISQRSGIGATSLTRALELLVNRKGVVEARTPLPGGQSRDRRYVVRDPYLRFWLRFIGPNFDRLERGQGRAVASEVQESWSVYRGHAIEPIVRERIARELPSARFGSARRVGGFWSRTGDLEVDLVGSDRDGKAPPSFLGSVKWRDNRPFDRADAEHLRQQATLVPGATDRTRLVGVSRTGFATTDLDVTIGPEDLLEL